MEELPFEINIITLNCWGLKYISKLRNERITEIGQKLAAADPPPHIVGLQECFTQEDYRSIRRETRFILPYGKFYHGGAFGAGLVILSKWPIEESSLFQYPLNGRPTAFYRGDWFVGKGVACAKIRYGPGRKDVIEVFNTHTHSTYESEPNDSYLCHRTAQAWEMAKLLRGAAERDHLVIAMGDFNMLASSLAHKLISTTAPVRDVWRVMHPDSSVGAADDAAEKARCRPIPTAEYNVRENGATSNNVYNTWRWSKAQQKRLGRGKTPPIIPPDTVDRHGKRLDYIFAGLGDPRRWPAGGSWTIKRVAVGMMDPHSELGCSLSDHFSVETTLSFQVSAPPPPTDGNRIVRVPSTKEMPEQELQDHVSPPDEGHDHALENGTYLQSPEPSEGRPSHETLGQADAPSIPGDQSSLPLQTYDEILAIIHKYIARERQQRRWRSAHFFAWLFVAVGCLVAVWFVGPRPWAAFILMLASTLGLAAGTVDGLIALLFVGSEMRALKEFEWEVMNAKAAAGGEHPLVDDPPEEQVGNW